MNSLTFIYQALSGGQDRKIHLWNPSTNALIQTYEAHGYEVLDISVSHDNARFASVGGDRQAFLWDVATATTLRRFSGHYARINCCGFNFDASVLVTGSFDATVRLWDCKSASTKPIMQWDEARDSVSALYVGDGEVCTGCVDGKVRRYDLRMGQINTDVIGREFTHLSPFYYLVLFLEILILRTARRSSLTDYSFYRVSSIKIPSHPSVKLSTCAQSWYQL